MKSFSKIATIFGGAALLAGCGQAAFVDGQADAPVGLSGSAIKFQSDATQTTDMLLGYYSGCQGHNEGDLWSIAFGDGSASGFKVTKGDVNCLWATGITAQDQVNGLPAVDGSNAPLISTYKFFSPTDPSSPSPILVRTNTIANPYIAANASLARKVDAQGAAVNADVQQSTMVNIGATDYDATLGNIAGPLNFATNFRISTIAGSAADLEATSANAAFIGYSYLAGASTTSFQAPNYAAGVHDANIKTDGNDKIIVSEKYFRFNKTTVPGTEFTYGTPGDQLTDDDGTVLAAGNMGNFAALSDLRKYELLRKYYETFAGNYGATALNPSATTIAIQSAALFPVDTNIRNAEDQRNVLMLQRKDANSGVRSFQAILIQLHYTGAM